MAIHPRVHRRPLARKRKAQAVKTDYVANVDALELLQSLPDGSVNCVVSSPPYFGLRAYLPNDHPDKPKEIGLEGKPECGKTGFMRLRSDLSIADLMYVLKRISDAGLLYDGRNGNDDTK